MQPSEAIKQRIFGRIYEDGVLWAAGRIRSGETEWFNDIPPTAPEPTLYYVRYALTERGTEAPILPSSLLDDWGNEITKLKLYKFLRDEGDLYPRSEVFGFDLEGRERQNFVRELELFEKYPCYVYTDVNQPIESGQRINTVAVITDTVTEIGPIKPPKTVPQPLRRSRVEWYGVPSTEAEILQNSSFFNRKQPN